VVAGYTNVGYRIRSSGWSAADPRPMLGEVVLVTGASSGLGFAAAEGFARLGATVWLVVRSAERGEQARARIVERSGNGDVHVGVCDLSELESVRQFAGRFGDQAARLDVLVNNAGVMTEARAVSADGIELTLATNVVAPFLLTNLLIRLLEKSARRGSSTCLPEACTRRGSGLMTCKASTGSSTGRRCTRAPSAHRSSLPSSGQSSSRAPASWSTRCTPAGSTPPVCDPRRRASTQ
jgi:NAD(P)-dependent dehydrogenase (short-subunit alcohol dehydrogenase family)